MFLRFHKISIYNTQNQAVCCEGDLIRGRIADGKIEIEMKEGKRTAIIKEKYKTEEVSEGFR
jgi:hypothetical protein